MQIICSFHVKDKATMDSLYWDTVKQIYGTHGLNLFSVHYPIDLLLFLSIFWRLFRSGDKDWSTTDFCWAFVPDVVLSERNGHSSGSACRQHHIILVPRYHVRSQFIPHHLSPAPLHERYLDSFLNDASWCFIFGVILICSIILIAEEDCYACISLMVASKKTKFITQTKLHYETIWRTSMVLCRRHAVTFQIFLIHRQFQLVNVFPYI